MKMKSLLTTLATSLLLFSTQALADMVEFTTYIDGNDTAEFSVTSVCGGTGWTNAYVEDMFSVAAVGDYDIYTTFNDVSTGDSFFMVYQDSFNPLDTTVNCIAAGGSGDSAQVGLEPGTTYIIVSASINSVGTGSVTQVIEGPGMICLDQELCHYAPVPTMGTVGSTLLVVLMLGVGMVAFRRYA